MNYAEIRGGSILEKLYLKGYLTLCNLWERMVEHCNKPLQFVETTKVSRVYLLQMIMSLLPSAVRVANHSVYWQLFASCLLTEAVFHMLLNFFLLICYVSVQLALFSNAFLFPFRPVLTKNLMRHFQACVEGLCNLSIFTWLCAILLKCEL